MSTKLAFRTPPGGVVIPAGQSKELGAVDVSPFERIRVVADERVGSGTGINIRLTITEGGGAGRSAGCIDPGATFSSDSGI